MKMGEIKIELPMILSSPGIFFAMRGEKGKIRDLLLDVCQKDEMVPSFLSKAEIRGERGVLVLYETGGKEVKEKIFKKAREMGIEVTAINTVKADDKYLPEETISVSLLGEEVTIIPLKRIKSHEVAAIRIFGRGIRPIAKKIGEEEGENIAAFELSGIKIKGVEEAVKALESLIRILECLKEIPEAKIVKEGEELRIFLEPRAPGEMVKNRLYGIIKGFFLAKGVLASEELEEGGLKLKIETPEGEIKVSVERA